MNKYLMLFCLALAGGGGFFYYQYYHKPIQQHFMGPEVEHISSLQQKLRHKADKAAAHFCKLLVLGDAPPIQFKGGGTQPALGYVTQLVTSFGLNSLSQDSFPYKQMATSVGHNPERIALLKEVATFYRDVYQDELKSESEVESSIDQLNKKIEALIH